MTIRPTPLVLTTCLMLCVAALAMHARASDDLPRTQEAMLELLPPTFRVEESRRFTVYTDASPSWLATQRQLLERTHHQVARFARRMGWEVPAMIPKQTVVLFANRADYVAFARDHDGVTADWVAGYYSPGNCWVVFYDIESSPSLLDARSRLAEMKTELRTMQRESATDHAPGHDHGASMATMVEHYERHLDGEEDRVEQFVRQVSIATTVHEATHQLLYAFGIQRAGVPYPFWLSEGLATNFETDEPSEAFGPDRPFEPRERRLRELLELEELEPLRTFISRADVAEVSPERIDVLYHQAYGFLRWAVRFRRDELRRFIDSMNAGARPKTPDDYTALFEQSFGNIDSVERAWIQHERRR